MLRQLHCVRQRPHTPSIHDGPDFMPDETLYSMKVATNLTGLTAHALRVWERRYAVVVPLRSEGNQRLYTAAQISRLRQLRALTEAGHKISQLAAADDETVAKLFASLGSKALTIGDLQRTPPDERASSSAKAAGFVASALEAIHALQGDRLKDILRQAQLELTQIHLIDHMILQLMEQVGERWQHGELRVAQEHLASDIVKNVLVGLRSTWSPPSSAPVVVVTTPSGQVHEIGALAVAATAAAQGWCPLYLGPSLPAEEIAAAAVQSEAKAVAVSIVFPLDDPEIGRELRRLREMMPGMLILVGGRAAPAYAADIVAADLRYLPDMAKLRQYIREMRS